MQERFITIVENLDEEGMGYILRELGKIDSSNNSKEIEIKTEGLNKEDIDSLKEVLITLLNKDESFIDTFEEIVNSYEPSRSIDPYMAGEIALGILAVTNIANNLIRAIKPDLETKKDGDNSVRVKREYESISDFINPLSSIFLKIKN